MSTIKINNSEFEIDMMDADTVERVEAAINNAKNEAAKAESDKSLKFSQTIRVTCGIVSECFNRIFGEGTDKKLFGDRTNLQECLGAFAELCTQTVQQPQATVNSLMEKYSPNRTERRHPAK